MATATVREYQYFDVQRIRTGIFFAIQKRRNIAFPGRVTEPSDFRIAATVNGIYISGDYGTNPSREEAAELAEIMREAVATYDRLRDEAFGNPE